MRRPSFSSSRLSPLRRSSVWVALILIGAPLTADAALWRNTTEASLGTATAGWTNKVDLADINGDGRVDILFANGSAYNRPGDPEHNGLWLNVGVQPDGTPRFEDVSDLLGDTPDFTRVIKGRDLNGDGSVDIIVGNTYETQSRLFMGNGDGTFTEATDRLPQMNASIGDLEVGDIDGDGDLDIVLADWGLDDPGGLLDPFTAPGGKMLVWLNDLDDSGTFIDETQERMPSGALVAWSWEVELVDIDGDFDLDVAASCKVCDGSSMFVNDSGVFTNSRALPQFTNNYDFEPMFLDVPSEGPRLALVTINDGVQVDPSNQFDLRERIFTTNGDGTFDDATSKLWPDEHNVGADDNMVVVLDFDSDGDPDFLIGALGPGDDRLHINRLNEDGTFHLASNDGLTEGLSATPGTLGIALADLNGDRKLDVVQSQGELADPEQVWVGDEIQADEAPPVFEARRLRADEAGTHTLLVRVHDNKSPSRPHDWEAVTVSSFVDGTRVETSEMAWVGEFYWRAESLGSPAIEGTLSFVVCARDAAGNESCTEPFEATADMPADALDATDESSESGGCAFGSGSGAPALLPLLFVGLIRRRRLE